MLPNKRKTVWTQLGWILFNFLRMRFHSKAASVLSNESIINEVLCTRLLKDLSSSFRRKFGCLQVHQDLSTGSS